MKKNKVCMKKSEFNNEHRGLIKLLRSVKGKKFKKEADEQEKEMRKYNESAPIFVVGIRLCEGPLGSLAIRAGGAIARNAGKIGRALWNRKGDIAAMALGAVGARKAGGFARTVGATSARMFRSTVKTERDPSRQKLVRSMAADMRHGIAGAGRVMQSGKGMLAGALGGLATKKAIGFAGRTAMRAGRWAKRKVLGEADDFATKFRKSVKSGIRAGHLSGKSLMTGRRGQQTAESALLELAAPTVGLAGKLSRVAMHLGPRKGKRALYVSQRITDRLGKKVAKQRTQASKALESAVLRRR